ncbi:MAG TPA: YqgE/AlgH family protein [Xanthobacteraceae bacterium]
MRLIPVPLIPLSLPRLWRSARLRAALAALVLEATLMGAVAPSATEPPAQVSFTGRLLVASPDIRDPHFDHAVILVVKHDRDGALGIVINMPAGERPMAALLAAMGEPSTGVTGNVPVFAGGPVQPDTALVLHSAEYRCAGTLAIDGHIAITANPQILRDMAAKTGPQKSLFAFGYAGWGAGQLESEMARNVWFPAESDPGLVFDDDRDKVWDRAMARRTRDL